MMQRTDGNGHLATAGTEPEEVRFFLEDAPASGPGRDGAPLAVTGLARARTALREAQRAEWDERQRVARAGADGVTPVHAALLAARQAQTQAAEAIIADLRRRAASLRHAVAVAEQAIDAQRRMVEKLRRELNEIGD